jgi:outer membrane protein assembly factor BamA
MANLAFGYSWKQGRYINHQINLMEMNLVYLPFQSDAFRDSIKGTYLEYSYTNHLVPVTSYTWQFNNQNIKKNQDFIFARINVESAGNIITAINSLIGTKQDSLHYKLFGIRYSQYLKADIDFRFYQVLNAGSMMVYRIFVGAAYPYGNAIAIPFEKLYFSGGANSIRGWQARTIGPGSYKNLKSIYPNSTGDIKLEVNIEYRFKLFWVLEGALFTDVGNIWAITKADQREGALFKMNKFYKDLAIGSGLGFRFDFKFFLFRIDLGMKMRDPSLDAGKKWIFSQKKILASDFALNIAIAYPF